MLKTTTATLLIANKPTVIISFIVTRNYPRVGVVSKHEMTVFYMISIVLYWYIHNPNNYIAFNLF